MQDRPAILLNNNTHDSVIAAAADRLDTLVHAIAAEATRLTNISWIGVRSGQTPMLYGVNGNVVVVDLRDQRRRAPRKFAGRVFVHDLLR